MIRGNTAYGNNVGLSLEGGGGAVGEGNIIYSNNIGISEGQSRVANNLLYDNAQIGIQTNGFHGGGDGIYNNTVVQLTGDALSATVNGGVFIVRNNIFESRSGPVFRVASNVQDTFTSDYNLFRVTGSGSYAVWQGKTYTTLADWMFETGNDPESLAADPQFVDADGPDGLLGYETAAAAASIIIDDGDAGFSTDRRVDGEGQHDRERRRLRRHRRGRHRCQQGALDLRRPDARNLYGRRDLADRRNAEPQRWPAGRIHDLRRRRPDRRAPGGRERDRPRDAGAGGQPHDDGLRRRRPQLAQHRHRRDRRLDADHQFTDRFGSQFARLLADAIRIQRVDGNRGADDNFHLATTSPGVDRGDPSAEFLKEPQANGARLDLGAYGNSPGATQSAPQMVQVVNPNGLEKLEAGQTYQIELHSAGLTQLDPVELINVNGAAITAPGYWGTNNYQTVSSQNGTIANVIDTSAANAAPQTVYQSYAFAASTVGSRVAWDVPVPDGNYVVRLHFAEPSTSITAVGQRRFDIQLQNSAVDAAFDVFAAAGNQRFKAVVKQYNVTASGGNGIAIDLVNLTTNPAFINGIEILRVNPAGVVAPTATVEASLDNGATWASIPGTVAFDRYGNGSLAWTPSTPSNGNTVLLRATATTGSVTVQDVSDVPFLIANGGNAYYVNDGSLSGDEYATAIGDNLNSGKSPDKPMASLAALLRAYDLDAGDVVYVDTGSYILATDVALTVQDSGVRIQGPVDVGHYAVLDRANTSFVAIDLQGADDVVMDHLSLTGGANGVFAANSAASANVTFSNGYIYGNSSYGININSGNSGLQIIGNQLFENAWGVVISGSPGTLIASNEIWANSTGGISVSGAGSRRPATG